MVFVTAYDDFALAAFERLAVGYILKPVDRERFRSTLERAAGWVRAHRVDESGSRLAELIAELRSRQGAGRRFAVKTSTGIALVRVDEIRWISAARNYVELHTSRGTHLLRKTLQQVEAELDKDRFLRIHRSTIVQSTACARSSPSSRETRSSSSTTGPSWPWAEPTGTWWPNGSVGWGRDVGSGDRRVPGISWRVVPGPRGGPDRARPRGPDRVADDRALDRGASDRRDPDQEEGASETRQYVSSMVGTDPDLSAAGRASSGLVGSIGDDQAHVPRLDGRDHEPPVGAVGPPGANLRLGAAHVEDADPLASVRISRATSRAGSRQELVRARAIPGPPGSRTQRLILWNEAT